MYKCFLFKSNFNQTSLGHVIRQAFDTMTNVLKSIVVCCCFNVFIYLLQHVFSHGVFKYNSCIVC